MENLKRYRWRLTNPATYTVKMVEDETGEYVKLSDAKEAVEQSDKQMEFICPVLNCNSKTIWNLMGTNEMKCGNCGYKWEA